MKKNNYILLLYKKLSQNIGQSESADLDEWLESSEDNRLIGESVKKSWALGGNYTKEVDLDFDADFVAVQQKINNQNAEPKVIKMQSRRWFVVAAALVVLIMAVFLVNNLVKGSKNWQKIQTAAGQIESVMLADGTEVWINENSTFSYSETFTGNFRFVKLKGEAFFEVSKNPDKPFVIQTERGKVKVLGTSFNVRDFVDEASMEVYVKTGLVELRPNDSQKKLTLAANEKGIFNAGANQLELLKADNLNALAWHTQQLVFEEQVLITVIADIEKMYGVQIKLLTVDMQNCTFSNTFENKSLEIVLETLSQVLTLEVEKISDTNYRLKGGICR